MNLIYWDCEEFKISFIKLTSRVSVNMVLNKIYSTSTVGFDVCTMNVKSDT